MMAKKSQTLTREEFASLITVGNTSAVSDPPAAIPADSAGHSHPQPATWVRHVPRPDEPAFGFEEKYLAVIGWGRVLGRALSTTSRSDSHKIPAAGRFYFEVTYDMDCMDLRDSWAAQAAHWVKWARAPGHDSYWRHHRDQLMLKQRPENARFEKEN